MSVKLFSRTLRVIDRIFQIGDSQVTLDRLDTGDIQPVLDISRMAEQGAIVTDRHAGGYFQVGTDHVHAAANTIQSTSDPYASLDPSWGRPGERWIWLMWCSITATITQVTSATASVGVPAAGNALAIRDFPIRRWGSSWSEFADTVGTFQFTPDSRTILSQLPMIIVPSDGEVANGSIDFFSISGAAGTVRLSTICWVGPIGVFPPDYAR